MMHASVLFETLQTTKARHHHKQGGGHGEVRVNRDEQGSEAFIFTQWIRSTRYLCNDRYSTSEDRAWRVSDRNAIQ